MPVYDDRCGSDHAANTLQHVSQLPLAGSGHEHEELLAPEAPEAIVGPHDAENASHHLAERRITGGVAVGVVDELEVVDVEHPEAERDSLPRRPLGLPLEFLDDGAAVQHPGEGVGAGEDLERVLGLEPVSYTHLTLPTI